jgi:hypothetical protein
MILLVMVALLLMGATTWLAQQQPVAGDPVLNRRLARLGLMLCTAVGLAAVLAGLVLAR